jgi:uncharacterized membrane protein
MLDKISDIAFASPTSTIATICLVSAILLGLVFFLMHLGQKREQLKVAKVNLEAAKDAKKTIKEVKKLTDTELDDELDSRLRSRK